MSRPRAYFSMVSYADSAFAIGGHDGDELDSMERFSKGDGWVAMANMIFANHRCNLSKSSNLVNIVIFRFCAVADELNDRIYTIGGADIAKRRSCRYYSVSTNTWDLCEDKNLQADTYVSYVCDLGTI